MNVMERVHCPSSSIGPFLFTNFAQKQRYMFVHYDNAIFQPLIFIGLDPEQLWC